MDEGVDMAREGAGAVAEAGSAAASAAVDVAGRGVEGATAAASAAGTWAAEAGGQAVSAGGAAASAAGAWAAGDGARMASEGAAAAEEATVRTLAAVREASDAAKPYVVEAGVAAGAAMGAGATAAFDAGRVAVDWSASALSAAHTVSREQLLTLTATAATVASAAIDWLKLDVARDFAQTISLFFSSVFSEALLQAKLVWGNVTNVISFDLGFVFRIDPLPIYITLLVLAAVVMVAFTVFLCMSLCSTHDAIREGHEHRSWSRKAKENRNRIRFTKIILFVAASAYLPVSRVVMQVFSCHPQVGSFLRVAGGSSACNADPATVGSDPLGYECRCGEVSSYRGLVIFSAVVFVLFTLGFPAACIYLIMQNRPRGSRENPAIRYDADGHPQPYTDKMYK